MARAAAETRASSASAHPLTRIFQFPPLGKNRRFLLPPPRLIHAAATAASPPSALFSQAQERKDGSMSLNAAASNILPASSL